MQKFILLLLLSLISASAQDSKSSTNSASDAASSGTKSTPLKIEATNAKAHIGSEAVVSGTIAEVNVGERIVRLNFEQPYPKTPFTAVIFPANTNKFPEIEKLKGKNVEVSGKIAAYHERPQIVLTSTNQLKVIEAKR
jgi:hypothetical protein